MTLSRMSNKNIHMVKQKYSNREKINCDQKCAKIDFSYEPDAKQSIFKADLRPLLKAQEERENDSLLN